MKAVVFAGKQEDNDELMDFMADRLGNQFQEVVIRRDFDHVLAEVLKHRPQLVLMFSWGPGSTDKLERYVALLASHPDTRDVPCKSYFNESYQDKSEGAYSDEGERKTISRGDVEEFFLGKPITWQY